jgi:hypothetical protein
LRVPPPDVPEDCGDCPKDAACLAVKLPGPAADTRDEGAEATCPPLDWTPGAWALPDRGTTSAATPLAGTADPVTADRSGVALTLIGASDLVTPDRTGATATVTGAKDCVTGARDCVTGARDCVTGATSGATEVVTGARTSVTVETTGATAPVTGART